MNGIIREALATDNPLLNDVIENYLHVKGKQVRPLMVMLSAALHGGINEAVLTAAAAMEMLHNASLIHDDVVDETDSRRGKPTVNSGWGNQIAVLVGDFFVSKALEVGLRTGSLAVVRSLSALGVELSEGEVEQICNARSRSLCEEDYMSMIRKKTASLFMQCMGMGAEMSGGAVPSPERLMRFAELLGLCFQIKDDVFDYFPPASIGKPTGNDLREGKVTLPLLYALRTAPPAEAEPMKALLRLSTLNDSQIATLLAFAREHGGIDYAFGRMKEMQTEAMELLADYPDSGARRSFIDIFQFIIDRDY